MRNQPRDSGAPIRAYARRMRREPTPAETVLWNLLRDRSLSRWKFRRQHPVGHFILDFCCPRARLAIELDGAGHLSEAGAAGDAYRTRELEELGIFVIRFENCQVLENPESALSTILVTLRALATRRDPSPPGPSPRNTELG